MDYKEELVPLTGDVVSCQCRSDYQTSDRIFLNSQKPWC